MGCHEILDPPCEDDAGPPHEVTLAAFDIDRCEVTVAQYDACVEQGGCTERAAAEACNSASLGMTDHPANCTRWEQATAYCEWAGGTLPTEAQWERAARGLDKRVFPWGNNADQACTRAVMGDDCGCEGTEPVGTRPLGASPDSAMDMAGNVAEWVSDFYDQDYYDTSPEAEPTGPDSGTERVIRGGHFSSTLADIRTLARAAADPTEALPVYGFRCVYSSGGDGGTDTGTDTTSATDTGGTGATDTGATDTGATDTSTPDTTDTATSTGTTATGATTSTTS
jgi:formylglycine-generating enzyme required for sulfatase activity